MIIELIYLLNQSKTKNKNAMYTHNYIYIIIYAGDK